MPFTSNPYLRTCKRLHHPGDAVFVTHDRRLSRDDVAAFAKRTAGIDIMVKDLDAVIDVLRQNLTAPAREELGHIASSLAQELKPHVVGELLPPLSRNIAHLELSAGWKPLDLRSGPELESIIEGSVVAYPAAGAPQTGGTQYRIEFQISVYVDARVRLWVPYWRGLEQMSEYLETRAERMLTIDVVGLVALDARRFVCFLQRRDELRRCLR